MQVWLYKQIGDLTILKMSDIPSKSLANASISGTGDVVVDILVEEPTDVVIGFVCTITVKQGRAKIDNFKLELVEQ